MLGWALTFLVVALIAGLLGFTSIAGASMVIAQVLFVVFLVLFIGGVVWNSLDAKECMDEGGLILAPMTRHQHCLDQ